jgi:micrococcal nuclease
MNKLLLVLIILVFIIPITVSAKTKVTLVKCIDGDTAKFKIGNEEVKVRFLGINAPEVESNTKEGEPYSKESADYTCRKLKKANKIELEYDDKSDKQDKYGRTLAYVFVDDKLLEKDILSNGYASVKYINSSYKYYDDLVKAEQKAKEKKVGIHSEEDYEEEMTFKKFTKMITTYAKKLFSDIFDEIFN